MSHKALFHTFGSDAPGRSVQRPLRDVVREDDAAVGPYL